MGKTFKKNTRRRALEYEKDLNLYWKKNNTFEKSIEQRNADNSFVFYDGPPFLTGKPHHGHLLISTIKDTVARYQTMAGKRVQRRWGWDCHGLPAEVFVEKQLGIKDKREIGSSISIEDYVNACRASMVQTGTEWEDTIERIGRWVTFDDAYKTMDAEYMESVWWAFKSLHDKLLIYEGEKILMYCTKDATPISKSEVAMENSYQDVTDPSVYVKFKLVGEDTSLLAWTTTPWTLPSNSAIAINNDVQYVEVELDGERLILAEKLLDKALTDEKHNVLDYKVLRTMKGSELVGKRYEPLFTTEESLKHENAFKVWHADFVHDEDGTGIAHESPAYGEEDYELSKQHDIPWVMSVDENGNFTLGDWKGQNVWEVNKQIAKDLKERGVVWKIQYIQHEYPHCHRCGTKLMYRAHPSWFMDIQAKKAEMQAATAKTSWTPEHLQTGRFRHILESAPDWNLSRDRYWATPIPVWRGKNADGTEKIAVIGSYDEFEQLTGKRLEDYHLPNVMNVTFELDGVQMHHVGKVLDCWFESGSMPFAQFHYPFENKKKFESSFPADFIVEAIDQTRGWFYSLTAVNVGLFGASPFKNLISTGFINAADGKKLSKKLKNYTDPIDLMNEYSADSLRFLLLSSPLLSGEDFALSDRDVSDVARKLSMIWNMYDFFTLYADVDNWEWDGSLEDPSDELEHSLDTWIVSRVHELTQQVGDAVTAYDIPEAMKPILPFLDDASNWYVRRSRKRFWKSDSDSDKQQAYKTLHYVLVRLAHIMAPFTPFLAEELYLNLTNGESVHLQDWPTTGKIDNDLIEKMETTREIINTGLSMRARLGIKVRQPLNSLDYSIGEKLDATFEQIIWDEVNVQAVTHGEFDVSQDHEISANDNLDINSAVHLDKVITPELRSEGIMRELVRHIQNARKQAELEVDDRIQLLLESESPEITEVITRFKEQITSETLTECFGEVFSDDAYTKEVKVEGLAVKIVLHKS